MAGEHCHPPRQRVCLLSQVHQSPAWGSESQAINLQCLDIENTVQSTWPMFINSIEINADQCIQGQISDLHAQIDELKDTLCDTKKSYCNEAALTKEHRQVKDLKSHLQSEANASMLPPTTLATVEPKSWVVIPTWSLPQPEAGPSQLPLPQLEAGPSCLPLS